MGNYFSNDHRSIGDKTTAPYFFPKKKNEKILIKTCWENTNLISNFQFVAMSVYLNDVKKLMILFTMWLAFGISAVIVEK